MPSFRSDPNPVRQTGFEQLSFSGLYKSTFVAEQLAISDYEFFFSISLLHNFLLQTLLHVLFLPRLGL